MKALFICGQDIRELSLGLVVDSVLKKESTVSVSPEHYLASVNSHLQDWQVSVDDLDSVVVVTGPGSFTSSRLSTVIANTIAFAKNIPVIAVENPGHLPIEQLIHQVDFTKKTPFAIPTYNRPAHITSSTP